MKRLWLLGIVLFLFTSVFATDYTTNNELWLDFYNAGTMSEAVIDWSNNINLTKEGDVALSSYGMNFTGGCMNISNLSIASASSKTFIIWIDYNQNGVMNYTLDSQTGRAVLTIDTSDRYGFFDGSFKHFSQVAYGGMNMITYVFNTTDSKVRFYINGTYIGQQSYTDKAIGGLTMLGGYYKCNGGNSINAELGNFIVYSDAKDVSFLSSLYSLGIGYNTYAPTNMVYFNASDYYNNSALVDFEVYIDNVFGCQQGLANVSGYCGANSNGTYKINQSEWDSSNFVDDDFSTYSVLVDTGVSNYYYVNYTIPNGATTNSLWRTKDGNTDANRSLASCDSSERKYRFRIESYNSGAGTGATTWYCHNSTSWYELYDTTTCANCQRVYEEAMVWDYVRYNDSGTGLINSGFNTSDTNSYNVTFVKSYYNNYSVLNYIPAVIGNLTGELGLSYQLNSNLVGNQSVAEQDYLNFSVNVTDTLLDEDQFIFSWFLNDVLQVVNSVWNWLVGVDYVYQDDSPKDALVSLNVSTDYGNYSMYYWNVTVNNTETDPMITNFSASDYYVSAGDSFNVSCYYYDQYDDKFVNMTSQIGYKYVGESGYSYSTVNYSYIGNYSYVDVNILANASSGWLNFVCNAFDVDNNNASDKSLMIYIGDYSDVPEVLKILPDDIDVVERNSILDVECVAQTYEFNDLVYYTIDYNLNGGDWVNIINNSIYNLVKYDYWNYSSGDKINYRCKVSDGINESSYLETGNYSIVEYNSVFVKRLDDYYDSVYINQGVFPFISAVLDDYSSEFYIHSTFVDCNVDSIVDDMHFFNNGTVIVRDMFDCYYFEEGIKNYQYGLILSKYNNSEWTYNPCSYLEDDDDYCRLVYGGEVLVG